MLQVGSIQYQAGKGLYRQTVCQIIFIALFTLIATHDYKHVVIGYCILKCHITVNNMLNW